MIVLRNKLFSGKEKKESKQGKRARHKTSAVTGLAAGALTSKVLVGGAIKKYAKERGENSIDYFNKLSDIDREYRNNNLKINKKALDINDKINKSNMSEIDKSISRVNLNKVYNLYRKKAADIMNDKAAEAGKVYDLTKNNLSKAFKKRAKRGALISTGVGLATGIGMNELMKRNLKKRGIEVNNDKK